MEPSDNSDSHSSGNGYKASFTLYKDYDIIFSCILPANKECFYSLVKSVDEEIEQLALSFIDKILMKKLC